jgi:transcriptional regulator with XRE-family HTH domain
VVFQWERILDEPERVYKSPLQEARRYVRVLENDPSVTTRADLAREMGVSRARITQIMNLLRLDSEVKKRLLKLEDQRAIRFFGERRLRPLIQIEDPRRQMRELERMLAQIHRKRGSRAGIASSGRRGPSRAAPVPPQPEELDAQHQDKAPSPRPQGTR